MTASNQASSVFSGPGFAKLRIARPTDRMAEMTRFYRDGLGLEVLARFEDHEGFDGVILGAPGAPYHFEFTRERGRKAEGAPSDEHLVVFYLPDAAEWRAAVERLEGCGGRIAPSNNPYWDRKGVTLVDPDGYRIVLKNADWPI